MEKVSLSHRVSLNSGKVLLLFRQVVFTSQNKIHLDLFSLLAKCDVKTAVVAHFLVGEGI